VHDADHFRKLAAKYREMAEGADPTTRSTLLQLVRAYEFEAERRETKGEPPPPVAP
jgi:hypothetical protein